MRNPSQETRIKIVAAMAIIGLASIPLAAGLYALGAYGAFQWLAVIALSWLAIFAAVAVYFMASEAISEESGTRRFAASQQRPSGRLGGRER